MATVLRGIILGGVYATFRGDRGACFVGFAVVSVDIYACPFCNITWYLSAQKSKTNRMQKRHE